MSGGRRGWLDLARSLGQALADLARAELAALADDLAATSRKLRGGAILMTAAVACAFVALASAAVAGFELLALAMPRWGAALVVCAATSLATLALGWWGRRRWREAEGPVRLLRRRRDDHLGWWQRTFHGERVGEPGGELPDAED
jgi:hypothetical protein